MNVGGGEAKMIGWFRRIFVRRAARSAAWSDERLARALGLRDEIEVKVLRAVRATVAELCAMPAEQVGPETSLAVLEKRCGDVDAAELAVNLLEAVTQATGAAWSMELESAVIAAMSPRVRTRDGTSTFAARSVESTLGPWLFRIVRTVSETIDQPRADGGNSD